uniref:Uncharacterized protein n=1 Tax=Solanum tuberosum TaxID=4113 RepID=M1C1A7_SOLTU
MKTKKNEVFRGLLHKYGLDRVIDRPIIEVSRFLFGRKINVVAQLLTMKIIRMYRNITKVLEQSHCTHSFNQLAPHH